MPEGKVAMRGQRWRGLGGAAVLAAMLLCGTAALAAGVGARHGLSAFGGLAYGPDFTHFAYVNPDAPKGGSLRMWALDSYDSLNPFIVKGVPASGVGLIYESLMTRANDEPDSVYGVIAESAELAADRSWVAFTIRPEARWWDDTPITAADVVFSFETLLAKGHPQYRVLYRDVAQVEVLAPDRVRFRFKPGEHRDLPLITATMPIISQAYWAGRRFDQTTLEPPLSSGPYRTAKVDAGRSITYRRDPTYWGRDLPVNRGRYNFDVIRFDYYRDRIIALQAFFAGDYDFREEFTSKSWAVGYDKPAVNKGLIVREELPDKTPSGVQAFFLNTRRAAFRDPRARAALDFAFDFEWTNKNIFYGLYKRTTSMFENSELAAKGPPSKAELALLAPYRDQLPEEVFTKPFAPPTTSGTGGARANLRHALTLLREAGWEVKGGKLVNAAGEQMKIEFLLFEATFQRVIGPYIKNLKRLGIDARMRIVDIANFINRRRQFDYDIAIRRFVQPLTPGVEQRDYWTSAYTDLVGSRNMSGIKNPVVDALVEKVIGAPNRAELVTATRALDRVLMWNHYVVSHWYKGSHAIAYWDKYSRPKTKPTYARGVIDTWWYDEAKARALAARTRTAQ